MSAVNSLAALPDPTGAATPVDFAQRLHGLMRTCGRSLDSVARRSRDAGTPISRATVHNLVTGVGVPRRESLVAFLRGCGVPPREQIRWLISFDQVHRGGAQPAASPARRAA